VAAVCDKKVIAYKISLQPFNTESFLEFVADLPLEAVHTHVLMDNVGFHHALLVKECLALRNIVPLYVPPYSPEFNPIENIFAHVKRLFRNDGGQDLPLDTQIANAFDAVRRDWCASAFQHSKHVVRSYRKVRKNRIRNMPAAHT
jgi:hypothetical protein